MLRAAAKRRLRVREARCAGLRDRLNNVYFDLRFVDISINFVVYGAMAQLTTRCPSCSEPLKAVRLQCPACAVALEGDFELPPLLHLSADDLDFVLKFVRASGSLKEMAALKGQSYPTIRNRLNEIIAKLDAHAESVDKRRHRILDAIAKGKLSVKEAALKLKEIET